ALAVTPSRINFLSTRQPPQHLRVLATFDRGGGSLAQFDVSAASQGAMYSTLHGSSIVQVDADGYVTPIALGSEAVHVTYGGLAADVPVAVNGRTQFTDSVLSSGATGVRAVHLQELRNRIDLLRASMNLSAFDWTDVTVTAGMSTIRAQHIVDL